MSPPIPPAPPTSLDPLRDLVRAFPSALVGYSGGVDSALLAVVLRQELGPSRVLAAVGRSASYPAAQWAAARAVAQRFDIPLVELDTHELEDPQYLANATNRCFFCKTELWRRLIPEARARGLAVVCDGTNAEDLAEGEHRPGYAAGRAAGVRSPLAEAGFMKADVRRAARELGLPVWDAPAAPCLSSRVAYGVSITAERLSQVERAEAYLRGRGVTGDLRVRHHGDRASIEVEPAWIAWLIERLPAVRERLLSLGFADVEVDPRGYRRGSLLGPPSRAERA
ncbi:MAG TPA: ATP-dependent sacrificial sulfur transferase LarE [Gemmatimonadales bacterium]|nr:ATP-dependent sacrificial sulfur transferase LarE [Gemmatimonadales bacterium]